MHLDGTKRYPPKILKGGDFRSEIIEGPFSGCLGMLVGVDTSVGCGNVAVNWFNRDVRDLKSQGTKSVGNRALRTGTTFVFGTNITSSIVSTAGH